MVHSRDIFPPLLRYRQMHRGACKRARELAAEQRDAIERHWCFLVPAGTTMTHTCALAERHRVYARTYTHTHARARAHVHARSRCTSVSRNAHARSPRAPIRRRSFRSLSRRVVSRTRRSRSVFSSRLTDRLSHRHSRATRFYRTFDYLFPFSFFLSLSLALSPGFVQ